MKERLNQIAVERESSREEELVMESLAPLRSLKPTPELRLRNRRRLSAALVEEERRRLTPRLPLWRRTISVSLPVAGLAILAALLAGFGLAWLADFWGGGPTPEPLPLIPRFQPAPILSGQLPGGMLLIKVEEA